MPNRHEIGRFVRLQIRGFVYNFLILWLILTASACSADQPDSTEAALTLAAQQDNISAILATSAAGPEVVESPTMILTLTATEVQPAGQQFPTPTLALPEPPTPYPTTSLAPTADSIPAISTTSANPATLTPVPISADATTTPSEKEGGTAEFAPATVFPIGNSSRGFPLTAYQFNNGPQHIVIVGGIHGGYEWNTILLAYELIDYFQANPAAVPDAVSLTIIPSANPDGQEFVTGKSDRFIVNDLAADTFPGRFNGRDVDLNRNWDCLWAPTALWRDRVISGGDKPFSESETIFLRDFLLQRRPEAVIFLHSAANGVFASGCPNTHQPSMELARIYGDAAGYPVYERFSAYEVTGDAGDWLSIQGVSSISVELKNHQDLDRDQNLSGILAVLNSYR